ncbi:hypothetical protein LshimejAT787_0207080 [Lyophyllum shimeji]|uniref:Uncharacterized protein n=1 Tax=Lyophyllum shimeji TaxID=47721 RepID=A0A9P3PFT3_LYOSH|nr:hypothetical protein LshimejAT787_0207080 [Lyophyllum shimeji]
MSLAMDDDVPPTYDFDACIPAPVYTVCAKSTEHLLQFERPATTGCPGCDYITETKHMKINMGFRMWGLEIPMDRVIVTLEGTLTISLTHRGTFAGDSIVPLLAHAVELYNSTKNDSSPWDQERRFSIPIPSVVDIRGRKSPTPPSFFSLHQNVVCETTYAAKFQMIRKGNALNTQHEIKTIPILYLPKFCPVQPPLTSIPRLPRGVQHSASFLGTFERVKTVSMSPAYPPCSKNKFSLELSDKCVNLSLPSPPCFTSGELIPFTLSLVFPKDPVLASALVSKTQVHLLKRLIVRAKNGEELIQRDTFISSADLRTSKEFTEGVLLFRGTIQAGTAGGEASWQIEDIVQVQYVLRAFLRPPDGLVEHIASFRHEEIVQLTTDYGVL